MREGQMGLKGSPVMDRLAQPRLLLPGLALLLPLLPRLVQEKNMRGDPFLGAQDALRLIDRPAVSQVVVNRNQTMVYTKIYIGHKEK